MEVIGTGRKACHQKVQQPRQTDTHGAADAAERDALTQQMFNHGALLIRNVTVSGRGNKPALAGFTRRRTQASAIIAEYHPSTRLPHGHRFATCQTTVLPPTAPSLFAGSS